MPKGETREDMGRLESPAVRRELQRIRIAEPMSAHPFDGRTPPKPVDCTGQRIQVTCHVTEFGEIVERWQFSETDVRWYRLECFKSRWITLKVEKRVPTA